ncbi:hypothetical protein GGR57DRAFT_457661 [Xylariaceae sp. FL1272]|nr:hypothetical protein GGR57DRAFT_457661 [Xylariaceae sp. FL1272]
MPRTGFERVRTGCVTCKARKVKCDEGCPHCQRCSFSGRLCGGYRKPPVGAISWTTLLQTRPSIIPDSSVPSHELQSLDFFRNVVVPVFGDGVGGDFWTRSVLQLALQQSSARNAVVAISYLYQNFLPVVDELPTQSQNEAVGHYNAALKQVTTTKSLDTNTVLLLAILFTCIEFLRGDPVAAIVHCRHGIHILRRVDNCFPNMRAIFRHLSIFPFFFGATLSDFPLLQLVEKSPNGFNSLCQAAEALDCLMSRCVRLVRAFDPFRLTKANASEVPASILLEQQELNEEIGAWFSRFYTIREQQVHPSDGDLSLCRNLEMRWLVCKIWIDIASSESEMISDSYRLQFTRIVELAREEASVKQASVFKFDMGMLPLLHFVVIKCRYLHLRLEAQSLIQSLGCFRESSWDATIMRGIAKSIIKQEHGLDVDSWPVSEMIQGGYIRGDLPSDNQRIRDSWLEDEPRVRVGEDGFNYTQQKICFFVRRSDEEDISVIEDWISLPGKRH